MARPHPMFQLIPSRQRIPNCAMCNGSPGLQADAEDTSTCTEVASADCKNSRCRLRRDALVIRCSEAKKYWNVLRCFRFDRTLDLWRSSAAAAPLNTAASFWVSYKRLPDAMNSDIEKRKHFQNSVTTHNEYQWKSCLIVPIHRDHLLSGSAHPP